MVRSIFMLTMIMLALLLGAFYYAFYTPGLVQRAAPAFIAKYVPDVTLNSLEIGGQSISYPEVLKLYNIKAEIQWQNQTYQIRIAELDFLNFQTFVRLQQQALLEISGLTVQRKDLEIYDAALSLTINLVDKTLGNCAIVLKDGEVKIPPYHLTRTYARIEASKEIFKVPEFKVQAYGGLAKGNIEKTFVPKVSETLLVEFSDLKSQELTAFNKRLFSQVSGEFGGTFRLSRVEGELQIFAIMAEISKGGTLAPNLYKKISGYIIDEETLSKAAHLIETNGKLDFDNAQVRVLKLNQSVAGVTVTLENKKEKLSIHETVNIDIGRILAKFDWKR